jgi:hypothetical protein
MANSAKKKPANAKPIARTTVKEVATRKATPSTGAKALTKPVAKNSAKAPTKAPQKPATKVDKKTTAVKAVLTPVKIKIVRDSFTMTESDHDLIKSCKKNAVSKGRETRKSEVVRAAIIAFAAWPIDQQMAAYQKLQAVKTGRPSKDK